MSRDALNVEADTTKYVADAESNAKITENLLKASEPTLTASQAVQAIKNGEISQGVIDAYNYYYKTNYTVDNPPTFQESEKTKTTLTDDEVSSWVNHFNTQITDKYGEEFTPLTEIGKNRYECKPESADVIILEVLKSADLTDEQKKYLLIDKFGITEGQINAVLKDPHYK